MKFVAILLLAFAVTVYASTLEEDWVEYKVTSKVSLVVDIFEIIGIS